jgi:FkbM family methyltransferase
MQESDVVAVKAGRNSYLQSVPEDDHIGGAIRVSGHPYELDLLTTLGAFVRRGSVVVDVGANIGNHTVYFGVVCGARIHAFEPNPVSRSYLKETVELNGLREVTIHCEALSDESGAGSLVGADDLAMTTVAVNGRGDVTVTRLDDVELGRGRIAVVKVDAEGAEVRVLRGAACTIGEHRPLIAVEAKTHEAECEIADALPAGYRRLPFRFAWTPTYIYYPAACYFVPLCVAAVYAKVVQRLPDRRARVRVAANRTPE